MSIRYSGVILLLLLASSALWAITAGKRTTPPAKYYGHPAVQAPVNPMRMPRAALDDLYTVSGPLPIPDNPGNNTNDTLISVLNISDATTITDLNVRLVISHSWVRDLYVSLTGPGDSAETVLLDLLPQDGADTLDGWFDDAAGICIMDPEAPLVGIWRPAELLEHYNEQSAQGNWTLRVWDRFRLDSGYVALWGVDINAVESLRGIVRSAVTHVPINNVQVSVLDQLLSTSTNSDGLYSFLTLPAGTYTIQFAKTNYDTLRVVGVEISENLTTTLDTSLTTVAGYYEYASPDTNLAIPDTASATLEYFIRGSAGTIADIDVTINITHTFDHDLSIYLRSPAGDSVLLADQVGGSGDDFVDCRFDDEATVPIADGSAPFTGSYIPHSPLSVFDGQTLAGTWALTVVDHDSGDIGTINGFVIAVTMATVATDPRYDNTLPNQFVFHGNYPNPFNATTVFRFDLPQRGRVELVIYNTLGQEAARVMDGMLEAGAHQVSCSAAELPSGLYFARLTAHGLSQTKKLVLLK
ncbi:MAG: proprotein convertase P-domain-containing protein [Calditrichota bacterium]